MTETALAEKTVFAISRFFAGVSFLAVVTTALEAVADWRHQLQQSKGSFIVTRTIAILQIPLGIHSLMYFLGTTPAPRSEEVWLSYGNEATCSTQAFLLFFSWASGVPVDFFLSLTFLLVVQYGWTENQLRRLDLCFHCIVFPLALVAGAYCLYIGVFGHLYETCYLLVPIDCNESSPTGTDDECVRTHQQLSWIRPVAFVVNVTHLIISIFIVVQLYRLAVKSRSPFLSERVAKKGMLYAAVVIVVQVPLGIWFVVDVFLGRDVMALSLMATTVLPLMGVFNCFVFMVYRREMRTCCGKVARRVIDFLAAMVCCCFQVEKNSSINDSYETQIWQPRPKASEPSKQVAEGTA